jgi:RNA polymerase sigma-70 factor (ECF subfamily)
MILSSESDLAGAERTKGAAIPTEEEMAVASYSLAEALTAVKSLSDADRTALLKVARVYARTRKTKYDYQDLLHEAIARILEGKRNWPAGLPFVPFVSGVIRGIAWEWRTEAHNKPSSEPAVYEEGGVIARIDTQKLLALFDDDALARGIVIGMMEGARGEELRRSSGLSDTEYESKRRKIRRRIERQWLEEEQTDR